MISADFLPHDVLWQEPSVSRDGFGNDTVSYPPGTRIRAWVQQRATSEVVAGRDTVVREDVLFCNVEGITPRARFTWMAKVFDVEGHPHEVYSPTGFDHVEVRLRRVTG